MIPLRRDRIGMQFVMFSLVGGVSTVCHFLVLWIMHEQIGFSVLSATTLGFGTGALVNYLLNRRITFARSNVGHDAIPRFLAVVVAGMTLNASLMSVLGVLVPGLYYLLRQCIATSVTLLFNFALNRSWTFRHPRR